MYSIGFAHAWGYFGAGLRSVAAPMLYVARLCRSSFSSNSIGNNQHPENPDTLNRIDPSRFSFDATMSSINTGSRNDGGSDNVALSSDLESGGTHGRHQSNSMQQSSFEFQHFTPTLSSQPTVDLNSNQHFYPMDNVPYNNQRYGEMYPIAHNSNIYDDINHSTTNHGDLHNNNLALHQGNGLHDHPNMPSDSLHDINDLSFDYFSYNSMSVPSSQIDLYPSHVFDQSDISSVQDEPSAKRRISLNTQQIYANLPVSKPKAKPKPPTKPKVIRQNSFPLAAKGRPSKQFPTLKSLEQRSNVNFDFVPSKETNETATFNDNNDSSNSSKSNNTPTDSESSKKSKNPGFYIKLDNLNNNSNSQHKYLAAKIALKTGSTSPYASPGVDSLFSFNRTSTPTMRPAQNLNIPIYNDEVDDGSKTYLRILEPDLGFGELTDLQRITSINSNITPSMKPPGTNMNGYFELDYQHSNLNSQANTDFLSPQINHDEQSYNNFNKDFELYLYDSNVNDTSTGSARLTDDKVSGDLIGSNFDTAPKIDVTQNSADLFQPLYFKDSEQEHTFQPPDRQHLHGRPNMHSHSKSYDASLHVEHHSLQVEATQSYSSADDSEHYDSEEYGNYLNVGAHDPERRDSVHSMNSFNSATSNQEYTASGVAPKQAKKKRSTKGAVCSICDKYISRDLIRHMRIHNEVGRFQCVYPKYMCKRKTQFFNRPYDYKKHLLNMHFKFDDPKGKSANTLTDKLPLQGTCAACGGRFVAKDWLDNHVLSLLNERCTYLDTKWAQGSCDHN